jgi:hypothetical protein
MTMMVCLILNLASAFSVFSYQAVVADNSYFCQNPHHVKEKVVRCVAGQKTRNLQ